MIEVLRHPQRLRCVAHNAGVVCKPLGKVLPRMRVKGFPRGREMDFLCRTHIIYNPNNRMKMNKRMMTASSEALKKNVQTGLEYYSKQKK